MATENGNAKYELRRQARGTDGARKRHSWKAWALLTVSVVVVLACAGVGAFLWFEFTCVRTATARVQSALVALSPEVDARLLELHVKENQRVEAGQLLARLDDTELRAALAAANATKLIKESQFAGAKAQAQLVEARSAAEVTMAEARVAVAEARVHSADVAIELRRATLGAEVQRATALSGETQSALARIRRGPREEEIQSAEARLATARTLLALYQIEVNQSEELVVGGIHSQYQLEERRTRLAMQQNTVREAELDLELLKTGSTAEEIQEAEHKVAAREADVSLAKSGAKDLDSLEAALQIRKAELEEAKAQLQQAEARRTEALIAAEQVRAAEAELHKAEAELNGREAALAGTEITSPVSGTVIRSFDNVGEMCRKGVPTILVTDDSRPRWVEGFVREEDAMKVSAGQRAHVKVPAGSGHYVAAVVEQVGLHTQSMNRDGSTLASQAMAYGQPDRVWVKLRPEQPLAGNPVTGTTAKALIWVR